MKKTILAAMIFASLLSGCMMTGESASYAVVQSSNISLAEENKVKANVTNQPVKIRSTSTTNSLLNAPSIDDDDF